MKDHKVLQQIYSLEKGSVRHSPAGNVPAAHHSRLSLIIPALVLLIFAFDILTPLGLSVWLLYFVPLLLCFWIEREYAIPVICGVTLLFLTAGYLLSPLGLHTQFALINRILFAGIFICASVVLWTINRHQARVERKLQSRQDLRHPASGEEKKFQRFADILNAELVPALNSVRNSLHSIRTRKGAISPDELARSEETIARAEQEILFTRKVGMVGRSPPLWHDLCEIIRQRIPRIRKRGIGVVIDHGNLWLYADPLLPEVFDELIDNTLRYGMGSTAIRIGWKTDTSSLIVTFEDDGVGIPFSQKQRIFHDGVGRGLVLAREILGTTGISIGETGMPEQGAQFTISVPEGKYRLL